MEHNEIIIDFEQLISAEVVHKKYPSNKVHTEESESETERTLRRNIRKKKVKRSNEENGFHNKTTTCIEYDRIKMDRKFGNHQGSTPSNDGMGYECSFCDYSTYCKEYLNRHVRYVHLNSKKYKCNLCGHLTNRNDYLQIHINSVHLNLRKYKCPYCDLSMNQRGALNLHINSIHLNIKRYKCNLCSYATANKKGLEKHTKACHALESESSTQLT